MSVSPPPIPEAKVISAKNEINTHNEFVRNSYALAAELIDKELDALEHLNRGKVVKEVGELLNLPVFELWYYLEFGEEECERIFNLDRAILTPDATSLSGPLNRSFSFGS